MKPAERDSLLERQVELLENVAGAMRQPQRERERERRDAGYRALFPAPYSVLEGERGLRTMLQGLPGFAGLWERSVPAEYMGSVSVIADRRVCPTVACECGSVVLWFPFTPVECPGGCRRWFLALESGVRVWRAPADAEPWDVDPWADLRG